MTSEELVSRFLDFATRAAVSNTQLRRAFADAGVLRLVGLLFKTLSLFCEDVFEGLDPDKAQKKKDTDSNTSAVGLAESSLRSDELARMS